MCLYCVHSITNYRTMYFHDILNQRIDRISCFLMSNIWIAAYRRHITVIGTSTMLEHHAARFSRKNDIFTRSPLWFSQLKFILTEEMVFMPDFTRFRWKLTILQNFLKIGCERVKINNVRWQYNFKWYFLKRLPMIVTTKH